MVAGHQNYHCFISIDADPKIEMLSNTCLQVMQDIVCDHTTESVAKFRIVFPSRRWLPGAAMESFRKEDIVFWLFCMGVPIFMAYNGGATAGTVDTIQKAGGWSRTGLGLLGAMDKIGMTVSAGVWGYVLQMVPAKLLLTLGLFVNAVAVAVFSLTMNCYVMYTAKLLIGLSEGLQWVWMPLWVVKFATEEKLPTWINLSGCVAAGVGAGLGILIAGFSTAHHFPYALPFQIEAAFLFVLFVAMLLTPAGDLAISSADRSSEVKDEMVRSEKRLRAMSDISNRSEGNSETVQNAYMDNGRPTTPRGRPGNLLNTIRLAEDVPLGEQLSLLWKNKLFCRATMAFASSNYINAGLAFIWIRLFIQLWSMERQISTVSFLAITGGGGAIGIALSSNLEKAQDIHRILIFLQKAMAASCLGALMTVAGLLLQLLQMESAYALTTLTLTWGGIIILCMGLAATTGLIQIVCNNSVENEKVRSLGTGIVQGANNFIGNSLGPFLPQVVMDSLAKSTGANDSQTLFFGALSIVGAAFIVFGCVTFALSESSSHPAEEHQTASPKVTEDAAGQPLLSICCCSGDQRAPEDKDTDQQPLLSICCCSVSQSADDKATGTQQQTRWREWEHLHEAAKVQALRRLQDAQESIIPEEDWEFPTGTRLAFQSPLQDFVFGSGAASSFLVLLAGYRYSMVSVSVPLEFEFGIDHLEAVIKLVDASIQERESCSRLPYNVPMALVRNSTVLPTYGASALAEGTLLRLSSQTADNTVLGASTIFPHTTFMNGGYYKVCYSPDGSMTGNEFLNAIVPVDIRVIGVASPCLGNGCLAEERWDCYVSYFGEDTSNCLIDFRAFGGGREGWTVEAGTASKSAWTAAWDRDTFLFGEYIPAPRVRCSDVVTAEYIAPETAVFTDFAWAPPTGMGFITDAFTSLEMPRLRRQSAVDSLTMSVCYCPSYDGPVDPTNDPCDHASEFIQPIGVLYYWLLRVCDVGGTAGCGVVSEPFMRVLPQQPFALRLQCPPGGSSCSGSSQNQIKFIPGTCPVCALGEAITNLPVWDPNSRCRAGAAVSEQMLFYPPKFDDDGVPVDPATYRFGGDRRDYKFWDDPYLLGKLPMSEQVQVCYCDAEIRFADTAGVARWSKPFDEFQLIQPIQTVEYVGKAGGVTLFGGIRSNISEGMHPYDGLSWRRKTIMKILSYDNTANYLGSDGIAVTLEQLWNLHREYTAKGRRGMDDSCAYNSTDEAAINGPSTEENSKQFMAWVGPDASQYLPFTGIENDQTTFFYEAGMYAVCYCSFLDADDNCAESNDYILAAMIMVKGTRSGQVVQLPTKTLDSLRLITMTQSCSENGNNPGGVLDTYRLRCPGIDGESCRYPRGTEDIPVSLISSETTGVYVESVVTEESKTILVFSGDVTSELLDGDAITLDEATILLNGRGQTAWTETERYLVSKISGFYNFADEPDKIRMLWNRISFVDAAAGSGQAYETNKLSIPVGWADGVDTPVFTFVDGKGGWHRRNRLQTNQEIKAEATATLRICWAANDGGSQEPWQLTEYYSDAGVLTFITPATMADAGVYFTSWVSGTEAPVVISFSPTRGKQDYLRDTAIVLRILLREIPRVAVPLKTSRTGFAGVEMEDNETVLAESMSQAVCGSLFLEMWTNDAAGFPLPRGCYYGPLYTDAPQIGGQPEASYREYFIEFDPKHALKEECVGTNRQSSCVYQLVLNMRIQHDEFITRRELISLYTYCAGRAGYATICGPRYSVIEYGQVIPKNGVYLPEINTTKLGRASDTIMDELSGLEISTLSLGLRAWPMEPEYPLQSSARFRLMFQPLTLWRLAEFPSDCNATCVAAPDLTCLDQRGLPVAPCEVKALVDTNDRSDVPMQLNVMEFSFPNAFDEIPEDRSDEAWLRGSEALRFAAEYTVCLLPQAHLLAFRGLRLPNEGFFTICMLVQYYELPDVPPSMVEAMPCAKKVPTSTATSGRILVEGQAGNGPKPFAFDRDNELVLRLILGASLRNLPSGNVVLGENETEVLVPAEIRVQLPPDYMQDLNNDGYADSPMATVRSGTWSSRESVCIFTLESTAALFANQFVDVRVSVVNPRLPLRKDDPLNVWSILLISPYGDTLGGPAPFISLEDEKSLPGWAGNLAVLGRLEGESIQPANLAEGANNTLNVFLQMTQAMPVYSYLVIDAPPGYDFTTTCAAGDLDPAYYQDGRIDSDSHGWNRSCELFFALVEDWEALPWGTEITGPRATTSSIGQDVNCTTDDWQRPAGTPVATAPFTRAYLRIGRTLLLGDFAVNSMAFLFQHSQWRLWLQSPAGYMVDGSTYPVQFNSARIDTIPVLPHDLGWAVYDSDMKLPLTLNFGAARPLMCKTAGHKLCKHIMHLRFCWLDVGAISHVTLCAFLIHAGSPFSEVALQGLLPTVAFEMSAFLTVYPLTPSSDGQPLHVRVLAPVGYVWIPHAEQGWLGYVPNVTCRFCQLYVTPEVKYENELLLPEVIMRLNQNFGFVVRLRVPTRPPTRSTNSFFLELGYNPAEFNLDRMQAASFPAPPLRVVNDVSVASLCNMAGFADNVIDFSLRIASPLADSDGILLAGDELTRGTLLRCWPEVLPGMLGITPENGHCLVFEHETSLLPMIKLWLKEGQLPAGFYGFRFRRSRNPTHPAANMAHWNLATFSALDMYPTHRILDFGIDTPSPRILGFLGEASFA
eukprot:s2444_g7.t1